MELFFLGILLIYCTGLYLHWRIVAWIAFVGAILPVFMTTFLTPESPLWLIHTGQDSKALKSLEYFRSSKHVSFFQLFLTFIKIFLEWFLLEIWTQKNHPQNRFIPCS